MDRKDMMDTLPSPLPSLLSSPMPSPLNAAAAVNPGRAGFTTSSLPAAQQLLCSCQVV